MNPHLKLLLPDNILKQLPDLVKTFEINTPLRLIHFLAQCDHESACYTRVRENLYYSAAGLCKTFKKYYPTLELAKLDAYKPSQIAARVYANRLGNMTTEDAINFIGRGLIQLTGLYNYAGFDLYVSDSILKNPDLVATKYSLLSSGWFWSFENELNRLADKGGLDMVKPITKVINGGYHGLENREMLFKKYYSILNQDKLFQDIVSIDKKVDPSVVLPAA